MTTFGAHRWKSWKPQRLASEAISVRAAIYARYSGESQRESSLEDQVRLCRAEAARLDRRRGLHGRCALRCARQLALRSDERTASHPASGQRPMMEMSLRKHAAWQMNREVN